MQALLHEQLSEAARKTSHGGMDYYPLSNFARALRGEEPPDIDVYQAVETAVPCALAVESVLAGGARLAVPDFRPGPNRAKGQPFQ